MKRYLVLVLIVFTLLLLVPLPALGSRDGDKPGADVSKTPAPSPDGNISDTGSAPEENATFKILNTSTGEVVEMEEREFVIGTVASEMPASYHTEALKAQAVASYTYYSAKRAKAREEPEEALKGADFSDVPATFPETYTEEGLRERWGDNFDTYYNKICVAVDEVMGKTITYDGQLIYAAYHAISSGTTETGVPVWNVDYPYLQSVPSPGDKLSPQYSSEASFTAEQFSAAVSGIADGLNLSGDPAGWITGEAERTAAGTVTALTVGGVSLTGQQVREALELRSACFTVEWRENTFLFTVQGYGHGVGMSQYGADYLARQGSTYEEILHYYYTGVVIS